MVRLHFNIHYKDLSTMHTGNIDTKEIPSPFTKTNIFVNSSLFSYVDKRVTQRDVNVTHIQRENCITYFCSSGDLLPNLSQTLY